MRDGSEDKSQHLERGEALLERNRFRRALPEFEAVLASEPQNVQARLGRATCLLGLGRREEGRELLRQLDAIDDPGLRSRRLRVEAWAFIIEKQWQSAIDFIDSNLALVQHRRARTALHKAYALVMLRRPEEAGQVLRQAWYLGGLETADSLTVNYLAVATAEPAIGRQAARALLTTRYAIGAGLAWLLFSFWGSHIFLVRAPILTFLFFAPLAVFEPGSVVAGWALFALACVVIGYTHRMLAVALFGLFTAAVLGGTTGILALAVDPELSRWACAAILLIGVPAAALAISRSNRRYRQRKAAADASGLAVAASIEARIAPPQQPTAQAPPTAGKGPSPRPWHYLVWPGVILAFALLVCRPSMFNSRERMQATYEGIDPDRIDWFEISAGPKGLDFAIFLLDLESISTDGVTDFSAVLLSRGDVSIEEVSTYLTLFGADGRIVDIVEMEGSEGPIEPGEEVLLTATFDPSRAQPRILQEHLAPPLGPSYSINHGFDPSSESNRLMIWLGERLPLLEYRSVRTQPAEPWVEVDVEVEVGEVLDN